MTDSTTTFFFLNCCSFVEFFNSYLDELEVAWHKTLGTQILQQLLLCVSLSVSIDSYKISLLYAIEP